MKRNTFIEYLKYIFLRKRSFKKETPLVLFILIIAIIFFNLFPLPRYGKVFLILAYFPILIAITIWSVVDVILWHYNQFKRGYLSRTTIPQDIKKLEKEVGFDEAHYLKNLEERVKVLESTTPLKMSLWAFIVSVGIAVALLVIAKKFQ